MRINTDLLLKYARDHVKSHTRGVHDIVAVYIQGSLLEESPLVGGAGDVDLVMIHDRMMENDERQIVRLTDEICLDIVHTPREQYRQPRDLRVHPWLGPVIYYCKIIYDPQHFMDFVQASVRGQFERADNTAHRSRSLLEQARQTWLKLQEGNEGGTPAEIWHYLRAVEDASNALVVLTGMPLTERRFLMRFPEYATAVGRPGLASALQGLIGTQHCNLNMVTEWVESWRSAFVDLPIEKANGYLDPNRLNYYLRFFETFTEPEAFYQGILWPLLNVWTGTAMAYPGTNQPGGWTAMMRQLNLLGGGFENRLGALDMYIDTAEEILAEWSSVYGA